MSYVTWESTGQTKQGYSDHLNEKLRSSCDSCAVSKVRCGKQKPRCQRCTHMKLECIYGPSRRKGKPGLSQSKSSSPSASCFDSPRCKGATSQSTPVGTSQSYTRGDSNPSDTFIGFQNVSEDHDGFSNDIFSGSLWTPYSLQSVASSQEQYDGQMSRSTAEDSFNTVLHQPAFSSSPISKTTIALNLVDTTPDLATTDRFCISMAFKTLEELYQLPLHHQSAYSERPNIANPSSDQILKINQTAVQNIEYLLLCECITCSHDSNMPFILATIGSKVLGWYREVYNGDILQPSSTTPNSVNDAAVTTTPITIGDFKLDHIAETRMKAQLLLCELQNLGRVFDLLSQRNRRRSDDLRNAERSIDGAFEHFLRASLCDLVTKLDDISNGHSPQIESRV